MSGCRALTKAEYRDTLRAPMRRLGAEESPPVAVSVRDCARDAWSAAHPDLDAAAVEASLEAADLAHVYVSADGAFTHVLLELDEPNVFIAIVVDNVKAAALGHHRLDLNAEYGL